MSRRQRRGIDIFNLSFLDVVSCGFGAIILLLVVVKISEPRVLEKLSVDLTGSARDLQQQVIDLQAETDRLRQQQERQLQQLAKLKDQRDAQLRRLQSLRQQHGQVVTEQEALLAIDGKLQSARQELDDEMRRLLGQKYRRPLHDSLVGGVPVDSEYIIFIIDTSGSMNTYAWPLVQQKVSEVLRVYPAVKGIQVMNDMGEYMFSAYAGKWIPDSTARRRAIQTRLAGWAPFSNSSPVEGIEAAISRFYAADKRISLYVFGDDFSSGSIERVIQTVAGLNRRDSAGRSRVRIHAVGFPVLFSHGGMNSNVVRFAALMRKLAENNDGSFVGLSSLTP
jgi:hypothetical protein